MGRLRQFEVWWAELPHPAGRRPVLLLTRNSGYTEVSIGADVGLPQDCVANCDNLRTVSKASLKVLAGRLGPDRWIEVKRAMGAALGWRELTDLD